MMNEERKGAFVWGISIAEIVIAGIIARFFCFEKGRTFLQFLEGRQFFFGFFGGTGSFSNVRTITSFFAQAMHDKTRTRTRRI